MWDVCIIGGSAAGCSAAIYCARFGLRTLLLDRGGDSRLAEAAVIENYPAIVSIRGLELLEAFRRHAALAGATVQTAELTAARLDGAEKRLETTAGTVSARAVIVATGTRPRRLGLSGEEALVGRGVGYCAVCDAPLYRGKTVGVVGGGNGAAAQALHLAQGCKTVHLFFRSPTLHAGQTEIDRLAAQPNVLLHPSVEPTALLGTDRLRGVSLSDGTQTALDGLFVAIGSVPESAPVRDALACDASGGILTDGEMCTALPGVFAAGDVRRTQVRQVVTAAADGAVAACSAERYLRTAQ